MIKITVEIVPYGDETQKRVIAGGVIINTGEGTIKTGHYNAMFDIYSSDIRLEASVNNFKKLKEPIWKLIYLALKKIYD